MENQININDTKMTVVPTVFANVGLWSVVRIRAVFVIRRLAYSIIPLCYLNFANLGIFYHLTPTSEYDVFF